MAEGKAQIVLSAVDKTRAAFDSAKRNLDGLKAAGDGLALKFGSIGVAISGALAGVSLKHLIDAADNMSKLSQKTGIAVESLTALKYAGDLSDVSMEDLATGLRKLAVNMADAASGSKEQQGVFRALGIEYKTASGRLRSTEEVLGDVADKFASFPDGPEKAAYAVKLFGRSGEQMIPMLNAGRRGLAEMREEAQKFGVVFGADLAKKAEEFNDNLSRLSTIGDGVKMTLLEKIIGPLSATAKEFVEAAKSVGIFKGALVTLGSGIAQRLGFDEQGQLESKAARLNAEAERIMNVMQGLDNVLQRQPGNEMARRRFETLRGRLREVQTEAAKTSDQLKALADQKTQQEAPAETPKPDGKPPPLPDPNAETRAEQILRKRLDARLQALRQGLEAERDAFNFANAQLANAFAAGELSIDEFYDAKAKAQQEFLAKQDAAFNAEIKALEAYKAKVKGKPEEVEADTKIQAVLAEQGKAHREAGQAAKEGEEQRKRATEDFRRSLVELDAQLRELSGDHYGAELLRNAQKMAEARALLAKGGGDPKRIAELDALLKRQAEYNRLNEQLALINERQAVTEEAYLATARARGTGLLEQERGILAIRQRSVEQLEKLTKEAEALARAGGDPRMVLWAQQLALALDEARRHMDPTLERVRAATDQFADGIAHAVEDVLVDFQSLDDAFDNLGKMLRRLVFQTLVTDPLRTTLKGWLDQLGPMIAGFVNGGAGAAAGTGAGAAGAAGAAATAATQASAQQAAAAGLTALSSAAASAGPALTAVGTAATPLAPALTAIGTAATPLGPALGALAVPLSNLDAGLTFLGGATVPLADQALFTLAEAARRAARALQRTASAGSGEGGGTGDEASIIDAAATIITLFAHTGGVVGEGGHHRPVPWHAFEGAFRYRSGGIAGLAPDEVPAVLHRGEEVLTQADPRHRDNGGRRPGKVINLAVNVSNAPGMTKQSAVQMGAAAGRAARAALARND